MIAKFIQRYIIPLTLCVSWAAFVPPAQAQWICHATEKGNIGLNAYWYTAVSALGNNIVVAADANGNVDTSWGYSVAFLLSSDGGMTWQVTQQGLPLPTSAHRPFVRKIEQIDSLHIVAFGDSGLLVRSTNAGASWQVLANPSTQVIKDISFSDSLHGILVTIDLIHGTYVTSDGGITWSTVPFTRPYGWQCHDYGNGMYRIVTYGPGIVYTTRNNWITVDSSGPIITDASTAPWYVYAKCNFGNGDTVVAYGNRLSTGRYSAYPCIARTTNGGRTWTSVHDDTSTIWLRGNVYAMSDINRDTIVAGLQGAAVNKILWSTDRGETWMFDTLLFSIGDVAGSGENFGIGLNAAGQLLGVVSWVGALDAAIIIGQHAKAGVDSHRKDMEEELFPNPATTSVTLTRPGLHGTMHLLDILGRETLRGDMNEQGSCTLNVSSIAPGIYFEIVEDGGPILSSSRVVVHR